MLLHQLTVKTRHIFPASPSDSIGVELRLRYGWLDNARVSISCAFTCGGKKSRTFLRFSWTNSRCLQNLTAVLQILSLALWTECLLCFYSQPQRCLDFSPDWVEICPELRKIINIYSGPISTQASEKWKIAEAENKHTKKSFFFKKIPDKGHTNSPTLTAGAVNDLVSVLSHIPGDLCDDS